MSKSSGYISSIKTVHIVDGNHSNRAKIANIVHDSGGFAQPYESIEELLLERPFGGVVLANKTLEKPRHLVSTLLDNMLPLPLILYGEDFTPSEIVRAAHDGVADVLQWPFTGEELEASCSYCLAFMSSRGESILRQKRSRELVESLSRRERQVLTFLLDGHSNKSMAKLLELSPRTIEDYRLNTMRKLGVEVTSAAVRVGIEAGLRDEQLAHPVLETTVFQ